MPASLAINGVAVLPVPVDPRFTINDYTKDLGVVPVCVVNEGTEDVGARSTATWLVDPAKDSREVASAEMYSE